MASIAPDPAKVEKIRQRLRQEWTDADTIAAWRKWHRHLASYTRGATDAILEAAQVTPGMNVLDLASGVGDPALSLAKAVAPSGHVTASDLGPGMFSLAQELAAKEGITNLEFRQANAEALPFPDRSYDVVTCRFALMLFPDTGKALRECLRVLKPGGRGAFVVFGTREQPFFTCTVGILLKYVQAPPLDPDAPHLFMFGERGRMQREMEAAGFVNVREEVRSVPAHWEGTAEEYWQQFSEVAAPYRALLAQLTPQSRPAMMAESIAALKKYSDGNGFTLPIEIVIGSGNRQ